MSVTERLGVLGTRTFGAGSVLGLLVGLAFIALNDPVLSTVGAVTIILGAVCLLFAVGLYLDDPEPVGGERVGSD